MEKEKVVVTIDLIREVIALNSLDVNATNAGVIRKIIGSGSNATIQKHLDFLRAELKQTVEIEDSNTTNIEMPSGIRDEADRATNAMFQYIAHFLRSQNSEKIAELLLLKDENAKRIEQLEFDLVSALEQVDEQVDALDLQKAEFEAVLTENATALEKAVEAKKVAEEEREKVEIELAQTKLQTELDIEKLQHEHDLVLSTLRAELDRIANQRLEERAQFKEMIAALNH